MKARRYYDSCVDLDGKMEKLSGQPLLDLLSQFYWNITDFDGAGQMESWKLQVNNNVTVTLIQLSHQKRERERGLNCLLLLNVDKTMYIV